MNAADVMVSNVITVGPDATVQEVAGILLKNKISAVPVVNQSGKILGIVSEGDMLRVPVVKDGKLVGIVSRANLLQAIATIGKTIKPTDATLREKVISQLDQQPLTWRSLINVIVHDGTAELWVMVDSESEKRAVRVAAETTPRVRAVADNLIVSPLRYGYQ